MYTIKAITAEGNEYWIHNPKAKVLITGEPFYEVGDNINGSAEFDIYPDHPYYDRVEKLTTDIVFYKDGVQKFKGRVLYDDEDSTGVKHVYVEGQLGYLNDSIQRPEVYHDISPKDYLNTILEIHNNQVEDRKKFYLGRVTVEDSNDSIYRYSNYETTRETLDDKLLDRLGGHFVVREEEETTYLDYLSDDDYYRNAAQTIEFGKNILDFAKNIDASEVITCLIPLGAAQDEIEIEGLIPYLTIKDVNGGLDYVTDDEAVKKYGRIYGTYNWDDVTVASNLKEKAEEYLKTVQYENMVLELTAVDMNLTDEEIEELNVGDRVRCISEPHGIDEWYPISQMKVYITDASKNTFTLGVEKKNVTYTASNQQKTAELTKTVQSIPTKSEILNEAYSAATQLINGAVASGYAIHEPNEFIVADDVDYKEQARNLWRWGLGGLAHYSNGYYGAVDGVALTMDGYINGKFIMAGSIYAESIDIGYTEALETLIDDAETSANNYTDQQTQYVSETVTNSITNLDSRIALSVVSTKEAITKKNYVTGGETETLNLDDWEISGSAATVEEVEYENVNCLKLTFTASGGVTIQQSLGTLPAGTYIIQCETKYDASEAMPSYIRNGFSNSYDSTYYSAMEADSFNTVKRTLEISQSSRTYYNYVYGVKGSVVYIKNLRCLRDYQELLDDVSATLSVAIDEVSASVTEIYENSLYDYTQDETFKSGELPDGWNEGNTSYGTFTYGNDETLGYCAKITRTSSSGQPYIRFKLGVLPAGTYKLRFKAACGEGQDSTARMRYGVSSYTTTSAGALKSDEWTEFEKDYTLNSTSTLYLYFYNYVNGTDILVTDVEFLGYYASYSASQLSVLSDSITSEVTRASAAEPKYGTCSTAASTAEKEVTCSSFTSDSLKSGATICVYFTYAQEASSPKLNVNGTGAKSIYAYGSTLSSSSKYNWPAKSYVTFTYNGSQWCMVDSGSSSKIQQLADSISLSVTSSSGTASIVLNANDKSAGSVDVVTQARTAFANESTSITISAGTITFNGNYLVIKSTNTQLTAAGVLTTESAVVSGKLTAISGSYETDIAAGYIKIYYNDTQYGSIQPVSSSGSAKYYSFLGSTSGAGALSIGFGSTGYLFVNNTQNPNGYSERCQVYGTLRITGGTHHNNSIYIGSSDSVELWHGTYGSAAALWDYQSFYSAGSIGCGGTKYRVVDTEHYGKIGMSAYETASAMFGDSGSGTVGEDGQVFIYFPDEFTEVIDMDAGYQVFLTRTSEAETEWVEKGYDHFVVHGEPGATFDWMVSAHQRDYAMNRLETIDAEPAEGNIEFDDSIFNSDDAADEIVTNAVRDYEEEVEVV